MNQELQIRPPLDLEEVHAHLWELFKRNYSQGAPHLYERLLPRLPEHLQALVRRKLNLIVQEEIGDPDAPHELITVAASKNPKPLERMGCVFFDVDGMRNAENRRLMTEIECLRTQ